MYYKQGDVLVSNGVVAYDVCYVMLEERDKVEVVSVNEALQEYEMVVLWSGSKMFAGRKFRVREQECFRHFYKPD